MKLLHMIIVVIIIYNTHLYHVVIVSYPYYNDNVYVLKFTLVTLNGSEQSMMYT